MKKIAVLYSWTKNYWWIYTFFRDIIQHIRKNNKNIQIDIFSVTDLPPGNLFNNYYLIKIPNIIKNFLFKFNLHILFSSLFIPLFFLKKLKKYDKIIINQELAFPTNLLLKNCITIIHWTSIGPAKFWWKKKRYIYSIYYFFLHLNCLLTYKTSRVIYTVSEYTKNLIKKYNKNIQVCWWGINKNFWKIDKNVKKEDFWFNKNDFIMIFVGRFDIWKWKEELVNIMKNINNPNVKLICISKRPKNYQELQKINIYFKENLSETDLKKYYSISDLFIFPTKYEGYWTVIAEALSIGLPVITTNTWLGYILQKKYTSKYPSIKILNILDWYEKYLPLIKDFYKKFIKNKSIEKYNYNIPEIDISNALKCWEKIFIE